jgi:hypothetical protein
MRHCAKRATPDLSMESDMNARKTKVAVIREELVALTGHWLDAIILNQFLYWSERTRDFDKFLEEERERDPGKEIELTYGWIFKSAEELTDELMTCMSPTTTLRHINKLVESGYLDRRRNPRHKWDRTWQYRPNVLRIQTDLMEIGYVLSNYTIANASCNAQDGTGVAQNRNPINEHALPETTPENTTKGKNPPAQAGEKESETTKTVANVLHPTGESAGERKKRELQEKFGTDPVEHAVNAARGEPGKRKTRPRGWEDASDDEWRVIERVAALWTGGKLPWGEKVESNILAAGAILDLYGDDARAAIKALDEYNSLHGGEFTVIGPSSLVNSMMAYRANGGKNGNGNGNHKQVGDRASYTVRDGKRTLVIG